MEDVEARFAHLLLPIRDLTRNWEVDVAAQLVMSPELHFS
ncbi:hypothetical protein FD755_002399 [Muntiacus reevesi]|uniref:Condensin-2 complex subunit H2 n=1 Tax=Muntiacus reevesi TaxID=9886 RepID=A0A5J5N6A4_MUNRE|nr:hypothetical protein FD755_002399 [Muntiacus reevesi]